MIGYITAQGLPYQEKPSCPFVIGYLWVLISQTQEILGLAYVSYEGIRVTSV